MLITQFTIKIFVLNEELRGKTKKIKSVSPSIQHHFIKINKENHIFHNLIVCGQSNKDNSLKYFFKKKFLQIIINNNLIKFNKKFL